MNSPFVISPWSGRFRSGTAASPGLAGIDDNDTGIIISSTNALGFVTGGTERWVINSSGAFNPIIDNTYDIGNGTVCARDIYSSRTVYAKTSLSVNTGTTSPATELQVVSTSTSSPRGIMSAQYNTGTDGARFHGRKARGTLAAPTIVVTGDNLTRWVGSGYDGSNYLEMASIIFGTEGTVASTRVPTNITFQTGTNAAPSVLTSRLKIDSSGVLTFHPDSPGATITASGSGEFTVAAAGSNKDITLTPSGTGRVGVARTATTTLGTARYIDLNDASGQASSRYEIGFGYSTSQTNRPVVIGAVVNSAAANTNADFYIATRSLTTDSAPIVRAMVTNTGNLLLGGLTTDGALASALQIPSTATAGLSIYNTSDVTTNYEALQLYWTGNVGTIRTVPSGSGSARALQLAAQNSAFGGPTMTLGTAVPFVQFSGTQNGSTSTTKGYSDFTGTRDATSGTQIAVSITPTYNQSSGTAANTDLLINRTQTAVGSGAQRLIDTQVGGVTKWAITNAAGMLLDVNGTAETVMRAGTGATNVDIGAIVSTSAALRLYSNQTVAATFGSSQGLRLNGSAYQSAGALVTDASGNVTVSASAISGATRITADVTNATATMSNLTDMSYTVSSGVKYVGTIQIFGADSTNTDGLAFDLGGGSATFTDIEFGFGAQPAGSTLGTVTSTTSTTPITLTIVSTSDAVYTISFGFTCNAGGTFIPRFSQNSHSTGTATTRKNSSLRIQASSN